MIIPPEINTKERKSHDLNDLRIYYMICEDIGIAETEDIQKSFYHLMKFAGQHKFLQDFILLKNYVDKLKDDNDKM